MEPCLTNHLICRVVLVRHIIAIAVYGDMHIFAVSTYRF